MMKNTFLCITALVGIFIATNGFALDGTGMWDYTEHSTWTNCGDSYNPESGQVGILQTGNTFLIVANDFSTIGTVSGNTYSYSDQFCDDGGVVSLNGNITLSSETTGTGSISWTWSDGESSCQGGHQLNITKQAQAPPVYDGTGRWNFSQSGYWTNCGSTTPPRDTGYFDVTQTGNRITALDDEGQAYSGFVSGATYAVVRSFLLPSGRETVWYVVTLSSDTAGSGEAQFVWDDNCSDCGGGWNISIDRSITKKGTPAPLLPLLFE